MENFNYQYATLPKMNLLKEYCLAHGVCKEIKKRERFATQGSLVKQGAYVEDGLFKYTKTDTRGNEHIVGYVFSNEYLGGLASFIEPSEASPVSIEAVKDSKIYCISFQEIETFFSLTIETQQIRRILVDNSYLLMYNRLLDFYCKNTEELYIELLNRCPDLPQYIPLKEIASFLQVTPETISHIRRKLRQKRKS